jgi:hypothetical protein
MVVRYLRIGCNTPCTEEWTHGMSHAVKPYLAALFFRWVGMKNSSYLPVYEDGTECSKTLAYKIQMPGNCPEESIQQETLDWLRRSVIMFKFIVSIMFFVTAVVIFCLILF